MAQNVRHFQLFDSALWWDRHCAVMGALHKRWAFEDEAAEAAQREREAQEFVKRGVEDD